MTLIFLSNGGFSIVDDEDFEFLNKWRWTRCKGGYAVRATYLKGTGGKRSNVKMHREILRPPATLHVDHINHNRLDNRRCNLRIATPSQNQRNRRPSSRNWSGVSGISWNKTAEKWQVQKIVNRKCIYIGLYADFQEAKAARAAA